MAKNQEAKFGFFVLGLKYWGLNGWIPGGFFLHKVDILSFATFGSEATPGA